MSKILSDIEQIEELTVKLTALETENAELKAAIADHELLHGKEWVAAVRAVNGDIEAAKVQMIAKYVGELAVAREALQFYADGNHVRYPDAKNELLEPSVQDDGQTARDALSHLTQ